MIYTLVLHITLNKMEKQYKLNLYHMYSDMNILHSLSSPHTLDISLGHVSCISSC